MDEIITNPDFWDCECETDYIHPKSQEKCKLCGAFAEDQPDSRQEEVLKYGKEKA